MRFRNEAKDFEEDTVTWPARDSAVFLTFKDEDGGQILEGDNYEEGITDQWHAMARAEQRCRFSRIASEVKFVLSSKWSGLEPGDYLFLTSEAYRIDKKLIRVSEISITEEGHVNVSAHRFDARILAWNANDTEVVVPVNYVSKLLPQVSNLQFNAGEVLGAGVGTLSWDFPEDARVTKALVYATTRPSQFIDGDTAWNYLGETYNSYFVIDRIPAGNYTLAVVAANASARASQWSSVTTDRWPMLSVGAGTLYSGDSISVSRQIYMRSAAIPSTPSGGVFNFATMVWDTLPVGWSATIPFGAIQLYSSNAIVSNEDTVILWSEPQALPDVNTYFEISKPVLPVLRNASGANTGYLAATGEARLIVNGSNVTLDAVFSVQDVNNCTVTLGTGPQNGYYGVSALVGTHGTFKLVATYLGATFQSTITVKTMSTAYQADVTPPPVPAGANVHVGLNTVFVELTELPSYSEGNGHLHTEVYGAPENSSYAAATLMHTFTSNYTAFSSPLNTPLFVWLAYRSKDNVLSPPIGPFDATTGKIGTDDIGAQVITSALIGEAAIDSVHIKDGVVLNQHIGNIIQSTNFQQGVSGWQINKNGVAEFSAITIRDDNGNVIMSSGTGVNWGAVGGTGRPEDGATRNVHRGAWTWPLDFVAGDSVTYEGSSWVASIPHTSSDTIKPPSLPVTENSYWKLAASKGDDGGLTSVVYLETPFAAIVRERSGALSPSSLQLSFKRKIGEEGPAAYMGRFKIYTDDNAVASYTSATNESSTSFSVPSNATKVRVEGYLTGGTSVLLDEITIPVVVAGTDAITVVSTNQAHTVPASDTGVVSSYVNSGTDISVFEGGVQLTFTTGALGLGQFSIGAPVVSPAGKISVGARSNVSGIARVAAHSAFDALTDSVTITYPLSIRRANGSTSEMVATQTITKSKAGVAGANGTNGLNSAIVYIYRRSASVPTLPSASTTYTFATGALSGLNNSWTSTVPAGADPLYVSTATAAASTATDTILSNEWTAPVVLAQNGVAGASGAAGANGLNVASVFLYKRSSTAPAVPSATVTYTFANGTCSGLTNGWTTGIPSGTDPVYVTIATASASTSTDTVLTSEWSAPVVLAQNGGNAIQGLLTNESHTVPSAADGSSPNLTGASTSVMVYEGATDTTGSWAVSAAPSAGIIGSLVGSTYTVTGMTADTGYVDLTCTRAGYSNIVRRFTLAKSKAGDSASAKTIQLTANAVGFTFVDGVATPGAQTITLTAMRNNIASAVTFNSSPAVTLTGTGDARSLTIANFGANKQVTVTASAEGFSDTITIVRLDQSTAAAGATVGANASNFTGSIGGENLLPNGSFEVFTSQTVGPVATGYRETYTNFVGTSKLIAYSQSARAGDAGGVAAQRITGTTAVLAGNAFGIYRHGIPAVALRGKTMSFSASIKSAISGNWDANIYMQTHDISNNPTTVAYKQTTLTNTDWNRYSCSGIIPANAEWLRVVAYCRVSAGIGALVPTSFSGTGTVCTATFAAQASPPFTIGEELAIYGAVPTAYNGIFTVTACTTTSVSFTHTATGAMTTSGNILKTAPVDCEFDDFQLEVGDVPTAYKTSSLDKTGIDNKITSSNISTYIADAAIQNAQIGNVIQSSSYVANTSGWKIDKAGNMELNAAIFRGTIDVKSATSGARLEIKNDVIKVFDAAGTLRVKLGNLLA